MDVMAPLNLIVALTEEARDFEILTEIQHYGGKTNLIDFTTDYFIALFFACDGLYDQDGRVIIQKTDEISDMITRPRSPRHRVIVQKSVFIRPPRGFIEPAENDIVIIPANLKQPLLQHLRDYHGIFTEVIYNDIHGFIRNQNIHGDAYTHFYKGFACYNRANKASTLKEKQREYEKAITHFTEAIKLKPDLAYVYNNRGSTYANKGNFDNAISDYNTAIKLNPNDAMTYYNRGNTYDNKGNFDNAISDYNTAIKLQPDYAEAYHNRGSTYAKKGDFEKAINDYTEAIRLNPDLAEAYYNRGNAYDKTGDFEKAINDYTEAIKREPDYAEAHHNRGITYANKGDFDNAINDYNTAIKLNPNDAVAYHNWGNAYARKGEFDNAINNYNTAIKLNPDLVEVYKNRGTVYALKGEFDNAIGDYTEAITFNPDLAEAHHNRGIAYYKIGEVDNAIKDFDWEKAKSDLITAKDMGVDIIAAFHNDYESVEDFEQKTGIQLPEGIAALLTPPQA